MLISLLGLHFKINTIVFISIKIKRDGVEQTINGKVKLDFDEEDGYKFTDESKKALNNYWLKG